MHQNKASSQRGYVARNEKTNSKENRDMFDFLATREEISSDETYFISIKLLNGKYIYEWFKSKSQCSKIYDFVREIANIPKDTSFILYDIDTEKPVQYKQQISKSLQPINQGSTRTRYSLRCQLGLTNSVQ